MFSAEIERDCVQLGQALRHRLWRLSVAESCTGGLLAAALTEIPGSSAWFAGGVVSYSKRAKIELLGVSDRLIERYGVVSPAVVEAMAAGAARVLHSEVALAISGIAGPGGGSCEKPVGTVCLGWVVAGDVPRSCRAHFPGERSDVRQQSVANALKILLECVV